MPWVSLGQQKPVDHWSPPVTRTWRQSEHGGSQICHDEYMFKFFHVIYIITYIYIGQCEIIGRIKYANDHMVQNAVPTYYGIEWNCHHRNWN